MPERSEPPQDNNPAALFKQIELSSHNHGEVIRRTSIKERIAHLL